ncbi:glycosyltransferase family 9 protein [Aquimarina agarivorans]|uniref:glycosyltransferase family 9 protein n=1 Tax=Aquimarina agarivorans TaxID=980584 RepID=UPI000248E893|nr:glycosyltransferase family 9 protein [Aquimarina agarivorans]
MKKILVIQNKRIGDVLIASVIAQNIKKVHPDANVDFLVYDFTTGVIQNNPYINHIIAINEKETKQLPNLVKLAFTIRKKNYDIIFDPYAKFQSKFICLLSGANQRIGLVKPNKKLPFKFYTDVVHLLEEKSNVCGKSIEDRVNMVSSLFPIQKNKIDYTPKIFLTEKEINYNKLDGYNQPFIMLGVLGSTPQKSMPYDYVTALIDFVTDTFQVNVLFNYAPHQKKEALKIYETCKNKSQIVIDIYEDTIRGFIKLMNKCSLLIGNEGGSIHIAKALNKPTFTIFSPYVHKEHWASFEDGVLHTSVHLIEEKPHLFGDDLGFESMRKIENDPVAMYRELTPELMIPKLNLFLQRYLKQIK